MQSNTTFFTGTLDPQTGEIRSVRVETHIPLPVGDLLVDVHYKDGVRNIVDETADEFYLAYQAARNAIHSASWTVKPDAQEAFGKMSKLLNTDPTLAQFYEPKQEGEHHETA